MAKIVIVGHGMVAFKFCQLLIEQQVDESNEIFIIGEEAYVAYNRVNLSKYFEAENEGELLLESKKWYLENGVSLYSSELVVSVSTSSKTVTTSKDRVVHYDKLVLATGSSPFVPPIDGVDKRGVFVYRTIDDLKQIIAYRNMLPAKARCTVLGGGLLGLEAAKAAIDMGLQTDVVEFAPRLMPRQLDDQGSTTLQGLIESIGIKILLNRSTTDIVGDQSITGLAFNDGSSISTDMLMISAGIRPRDELGKAIGLSIGDRGGIVVDSYMRTSDSDIYAIGEVACYKEMCYGLVAPGYEMAQVAVSSILGGEGSMRPEVDMSTKLKLIGIDVASFGDSLDTADVYHSIVVNDKLNNVYKRINVDKHSGHLMGGILVGDASHYTILHGKYINKESLGETPESLVYGADVTGEGIDEMPDTAVICTCESVTKGTLCNAVEEQECHTIKRLTTITKAGTGCGGCKPLVADILEYSLKNLGLDAKPTICEHFAYSRQELYDIIHIKEIRSYDDLLDTIGQGDGCEICKPAVASIFASLYAETATVQEDIQDTNDRFLANIQRNGSYSVVPRVPGGEISPAKLIVLGEVAQKYKLYTKITGGQRIDLFGAKLNDLPEIWRELIEAGFESGHAYGKALRTVKSCVGSTWCRYGLDESVTFAIELENRYKGIRSPHKLKGGVSGCIRECAEARCKDFGVIATETGWNLYVGGNGGANPKHAYLLAEHIDNETCIKYIDRFLMYYIKTAAPLQRTAAWLEKLNGGIDYLKKVVVQDTLGIASELEREMNTLVENYICEWTEVVQNPDLQNRFSHYINVDEHDENMVFVPMRAQMMPKQWV